MRSLNAISCVALLVVLTGLSQGAEPSLVHTRLFENGKLKDGQNVFYRIPGIAVAKDGTILAFCNGRVGTARDGCTYVQALLRRSKDNGKTWEPMQTLLDKPGWGASSCGAVADPTTGEIMFEAFLRPASLEARKAYEASPEPRELAGKVIGRSVDNGKTWKFEKMIVEPNRHGMVAFSGGSDSGIVLKTGPKKGRLMIPGRSGYKHYGYNCALYSDNHGKTWKTSGFVPGGEGCLVELSDGRLYFNSRIGPEGWRLTAVSKDQGETWSQFADSQWLRDCAVGSSDSLVAVPESVAGRHMVVFTNPSFYRPRASYWDRRKMTATVSLDDAKTWPIKKTIFEGPSGYSASTLAADGSILVLYEKGVKFYRDKGISIARFNTAWLFDGKAPRR
jgi:sialidase-1